MLLIAAATYAQDAPKEHVTQGRGHAKEQLKLSLADTTLHNAAKNTEQLLIAKKDVAISIAEPYLFSVYGKDAIIGEKPYEAYLIDNYWVILGTLPEGMMGGVFLIILDATNGRVVRITHGK
mgnify:FL=1